MLFEMVYQLNEWSFDIMFKGKSCIVLSYLDRTEDVKYSSLVNALKDGLDPANQDQLYTAWLKTRVRQSEES